MRECNAQFTKHCHPAVVSNPRHMASAESAAHYLSHRDNGKIYQRTSYQCYQKAKGTTPFLSVWTVYQKWDNLLIVILLLIQNTHPPSTYRTYWNLMACPSISPLSGALSSARDSGNPDASNWISMDECPQSNSQKRVHVMMKQYLGCYLSYQQEDW